MNQQPHETDIMTGYSATMEWLMQLIDIDGPEVIGHQEIELSTFYFPDVPSVEAGDE